MCNHFTILLKNVHGCRIYSFVLTVVKQILNKIASVVIYFKELYINKKIIFLKKVNKKIFCILDKKKDKKQLNSQKDKKKKNRFKILVLVRFGSVHR
jgi:hypothetical protein